MRLLFATEAFPRNDTQGFTRQTSQKRSPHRSAGLENGAVAAVTANDGIVFAAPFDNAKCKKFYNNLC